MASSHLHKSSSLDLALKTAPGTTHYHSITGLSDSSVNNFRSAFENRQSQQEKQQENNEPANEYQTNKEATPSLVQPIAITGNIVKQLISSPDTLMALCMLNNSIDKAQQVLKVSWELETEIDVYFVIYSDFFEKQRY